MGMPCLLKLTKCIADVLQTTFWPRASAQPHSQATEGQVDATRLRNTTPSQAMHAGVPCERLVVALQYVSHHVIGPMCLPHAVGEARQ